MYQNEGIAAALGVFLFIIVPISVIMGILFLLTLQNTLKKVSPENRTMSPGQVWLNLIPFFNFIWMFITISRISESLHNEFVMRGIQAEDEPGKKIGLAYTICAILSIIPLIRIVLSIASLVLWIMYWSKIAGFSNLLDDSSASPVQPLEIK